MSLIAAILAVVVPVAAGFVAKLIAEANEYVANLPGPLPSLIGVVVAFLASVVSQKLGVVLPGSLAGFDQNVIAAALSAVVALILHTNTAVQASRARR
jgi:uncharacterized membrane protein YeaQ/YmgE (transglycosylase-associated protein family)